MGDSVPSAKLKHLRQISSQKSTESNKDFSDLEDIADAHMKNLRVECCNRTGYAAPKLDIKHLFKKPKPVVVNPILAFHLQRGLVRKWGRFCLCNISVDDITENPQLTTRRKNLLEKYYKSFKEIYVLLAMTEAGEEYYFPFSSKDIETMEDMIDDACSNCKRP